MADDIIQISLPQVESAFKKNADEYFKFLKKNLDLFQVYQKTLMDKSPGKNEDGSDQLVSPKKLREHLHTLRDWLNSEEKDAQFLFTNPPWQHWAEQQNQLYDKFEKTCSLPYTEIPFEVTESDSKIKRVNKKFAFRRYDLNRKRSLKRASKMGVEESGRSFDVHNFIQNFIALPTADFLFEKWQQISGLYSQILYELHQASEAVEDQALCAKELDSEDSSYWDILKAHNPKKEVIEYFAIGNKLLDNFNEFKKESTKQDKVFISELEDQINIAWKLAGSPLLSSGDFNKRTIDKKWKRIDQKFYKGKKRWDDHLRGSKEEWLKDLELSELQLFAVEMHGETLEFISEKMQNRLLPIFKDIKNDVISSLANFQKTNKISEDQLRKELLVENRALVKILRQQKLPQLLDTITQANFAQTFQGFFKRIEDQIEKLTNSHIVFVERDLEHIPPDSKMTEVPLKGLVEDEILSRALNSFSKLQEDFSRDMEGSIRGISSLDQIVEFNLEAAYNLLKERSDEKAVSEARDIAVSGLERTKGNLEDLENQISKDLTKSSDIFSEIVRKFELDLQKLADSKKILELKLRLARTRSKEKLIETRNKSWLKLKSFFPRIVRIFLSSVAKIRSGIFEFQKVTRLGPQEQASGDQITRFLIETYQKIKKMPYIYQRLFRLDPLEEKRFFYGRNLAIDQMKEDFKNFEQGFQALTAIVGEKGNGKTTILNFSQKEIFSGYQVTKIDCHGAVYNKSEFLTILKVGFGFSEIKTIEEFEERLQNLPEKQICIFENIHNLFLRVIDGFAVMERFLLLISNTRSNVFWIVTSGLYGWQYLDRVLKISDYFKRILVLDSLSVEDVKQIILTRHQVSGYGLHFQESEKVLRSRYYKKLSEEEDKQEYLRERFFEELAESSGGNIKSALIFWLSALKEFDEEKINVAGQIELNHSILFQLSAEEYFTLAALIQHEYLKHDQHALIFNQDLDASRSVIGRLYKKGFLDRTDDQYLVHPLLYRPVVKVLKSKNILN